jgi:hypothetical protein
MDDTVDEKRATSGKPKDVSPQAAAPLPPWPSSAPAHDPIHHHHLPPEEIALPESRPSSRNSTATNNDSGSQAPGSVAETMRMGRYMGYVQKLAATQFPQLHVLSATPEYESALNVEVMDFLTENQGMRRKPFRASPPPQTQWSPCMTTAEVELLEYLQRERETDVAYRVILVEDLSPGIMEILGATTSEVDPEFFAEHLIESDYHGHYKPEPAREWNTRGCKKQYFSMQWHRPVRLSMEQVEHVKKPKSGVQIFRPYQELFDVSVEGQLRERYAQKKLVCWSERVSSWSSQDGKSCISM